MISSLFSSELFVIYEFGLLIKICLLPILSFLTVCSERHIEVFRFFRCVKMSLCVSFILEELPLTDENNVYLWCLSIGVWYLSISNSIDYQSIDVH